MKRRDPVPLAQALDELAAAAAENRACELAVLALREELRRGGASLAMLRVLEAAAGRITARRLPAPSADFPGGRDPLGSGLPASGEADGPAPCPPEG